MFNLFLINGFSFLIWNLYTRKDSSFLIFLLIRFWQLFILFLEKCILAYLLLWEIIIYSTHSFLITWQQELILTDIRVFKLFALNPLIIALQTHLKNTIRIVTVATRHKKLSNSPEFFWFILLFCLSWILFLNAFDSVFSPPFSCMS